MQITSKHVVLRALFGIVDLNQGEKVNSGDLCYAACNMMTAKYFGGHLARYLGLLNRWQLPNLLLSVLLASHSLAAATAPKITSITPASGVVGTTTILTGTTFAGATTDKFKGTATGDFTVVSSTEQGVGL